IEEDGHWCPHRAFAFLTCWQPTICYAVRRCNHDVKLVTNLAATKNLSSTVPPKKQVKSHNISALLAEGLRRL
ncbi:hypothetical protein K439DRAFT_1377109, partial [Ramaria rubella]